MMRGENIINSPESKNARLKPTNSLHVCCRLKFNCLLVETGTIDDMPSVGVPVPPVYQFGAQNCSITSVVTILRNKL